MFLTEFTDQDPRAMGFLLKNEDPKESLVTPYKKWRRECRNYMHSVIPSVSRVSWVNSGQDQAE